MKSILIDLYKTKDLNSGLGQFSRNFGKEISSRELNDFTLDFLTPNKGTTNESEQKTGVIKGSLLKRYLPFTNKKFEIWHSLHQFPSFLPNKNSIWILTIHDLNFLIEKQGAKRKKYWNKLQRNIDRADCITTISNFSKQEIEKNFNLGQKEVRVIYNGVSSGEDIEKIKPDFIGNEQFFFSIGIFSAKKNFKVLIPLMKYFPDYKLVIAGKNDTSYGEEIKKEILKHQLQERIILPGEINDSNKQWLYANCKAFLFPSIAEGFGLPVIEAMYEGAPVFLSKHTSLPEIGGDFAFYFDDFNSEKMFSFLNEKMRDWHENKNEREEALKKYAAKFNWKTCIDQYLELYRELSIPE